MFINEAKIMENLGEYPAEKINKYYKSISEKINECEKEEKKLLKGSLKKQSKEEIDEIMGYRAIHNLIKHLMSITKVIIRLYHLKRKEEKKQVMKL